MATVDPALAKVELAKAELAKAEAAKSITKKKEYKNFTVDLWITNLNTTEVGVYQYTRYQAKSRQFTKDMDIFGEVKEDGERKAVLAYREGLWKEGSGMDRRLVIKLFSDAMNWKGTMDLMLGRSLQLTHGAGKFPVLSFSINLANEEHMIQVERSAYKWVGLPEKFSFFVIRDGKPHFYRLRRKWVSIGVDYKLYDQHNNKIGELDGKIFQLGGKWKVSVLKDHADAQLCSVLQLFCGMLKFNNACRHHIEDLIAGIHEGKFEPKLETGESDLYMNPRRSR